MLLSYLSLRANCFFTILCCSSIDSIATSFYISKAGQPEKALREGGGNENVGKEMRRTTKEREFLGWRDTTAGRVVALHALKLNLSLGNLYDL